MGSAEDRVTIAGITLSNPGRILYPGQGITKHGLAAYYETVADWILPYVTKRPLTLVRCPGGRQRKCFYQKHISEEPPKSVGSTLIVEEDGSEEYYPVIRDASGLIALVQMGVLEIHIWGSRADKPDAPDMVVFDFDPGPDAAWQSVIDGARLVRDRLLDLGLHSFVKTSGGKGLHVVAPIMRRSAWDELRAVSKAISEDIVRQDPVRFIATASKSMRKGKVFIDYLRNSRGATCVAPYSTRAHTGAPVSMPLRWDELSPDLRPNAYNIDNLHQRLDSFKQDPWKGFFELRQSITARAKKELGL